MRHAATSVKSLITSGGAGQIIDIECHIANSLPSIVIVGYANKAVDEARERLRGAFAQSGLGLPRKRLILNLAPADIPKTDSGFDLAMAVSIMTASGSLPRSAVTDQTAFVGELGLDGTLRPVRGIIGKIMHAKAEGITSFYLPDSNMAQARLVPDVRLIPVSSLRQLAELLHGNLAAGPNTVGTTRRQPPARQSLTSHNISETAGSLDEVAGHEFAKRGLAIAAGGGHNMLLYGPPGTGKSMLAKAMPGLLPPLSDQEVIEATHLHSLASRNFESVVSVRPFRAPHHTASTTALTGGGTPLRPGELSLAHRGVLFLDELPEFPRASLELLRQPLEDRAILVSRLREQAAFPADFILIATANPCPCGYYGTARPCRCTAHIVQLYQQKLSGPLLDRIDLYAYVEDAEQAGLLGSAAPSANEDKYAAQVRTARELQAKRFNSAGKLNAVMTNTELRSSCRLDRSAAAHLQYSAKRLHLSTRAYLRTVKVARTIADLDNCPEILISHLDEALSYRRERVLPLID